MAWQACCAVILSLKESGASTKVLGIAIVLFKMDYPQSYAIKKSAYSTLDPLNQL